MDLADRFAMLWEDEDAPPDVFEFLRKNPTAPLRQCADVLLIDQHQRWNHGTPLPVEAYLDAFPTIEADPELKLDLVFSELRKATRGQPGAHELARFITRFPDLGNDLIRQAEVADWLDTRKGGSFADAAIPHEPGDDHPVEPVTGRRSGELRGLPVPGPPGPDRVIPRRRSGQRERRGQGRKPRRPA